MKKIHRYLVILLIASLFTNWFVPIASADTFNQNRIIDDAIFNNSGSMAAGNINAFLNQFPNSCISPNSGFQARIPSGYSPSGGYAYGSYGSAGDVIATAAQVYGINPQVLLVTLQKEQSLVSGGGSGYCDPANDNNHKYAAAVGYGCPDSPTKYNYSGLDLYRRNGVTQTSVGPTCVNSASKAGFSQQVIRGAWLLKFGQQRALGNTGWAVIGGSWDNSDDPQSCYAGPMTQGTFRRCANGSAAYYDGYTTIDGVATHMDSGATAALYWYTPHLHGNQNFFNLFTGWFGSTSLPMAFKTASSSTVYVQAAGYKFTVPSMALLQDYGISPTSIQTISQASADSVPIAAPGSGISSSLSYLIKSPSDADVDGGTVYLVSEGKKSPLVNYQQFIDFGFSESNISYLPFSFLDSIAGSHALSNYLQTPQSLVFQIANNGQKRPIFDYQTFASLNASEIVTPVSENIINSFAAGKPLSNNEILVKSGGNDAVYLYTTSGNYYAFPSLDTYSCWGGGSSSIIPYVQIPDNSYIAPITASGSLSCAIKNGQSGTTYLLSKDLKYIMPAGYGSLGLSDSPADVVTAANKIPSASSPLKQAVKSSQGATVWLLEGGTKRPIPSISNLVLLGFDSSKLDTLASGTIAIIPTGANKLGIGKPVKTPSSSTVYVITENGRVAIGSSDDFTAYHFSWSNIETYDASFLDTSYPYSGTLINRYFYDQSTTKTYLADPSGCYNMNNSQLISYGKDQGQIAGSQTYTKAIFPGLSLADCGQASVYVKQPGQPIVYWVDNGVKHPFDSWSALTNHSGQPNPSIINLSPGALETLTSGSTIQ